MNVGITLGKHQFKAGVIKAHGYYDTQMGMVFFCCEEHKIYFPVPYHVPYTLYGEEVDMLVREDTGEYIEQLMEDDVILGEEGKDVIVLTEDRAIKRLDEKVESIKIRLVPKALKAIGALLFCLIVTVLCAIFFRKIIPLAGCIVITLLVFLRTRKLYRKLNSRRVYDMYGQWVDLDTGESNLNGGSSFKV